MNLSGKTVLVTGSHGFLGRHLCHALEARGALVQGTRSADYDLTKPGHACGLLNRVRPEVVVHCAARVGGIAANLAAPADFIRDNLSMGANLIEASRIVGVSKLCVIGTTCSYPGECAVPFTPDNFHNGYPESSNAPYGVAKRTLLTLLDAYYRQYGLEFVYPVLANLFGPGESFDDGKSHVVAALIKKFIAAQESGADYVEIWGNGTASRELLFVSDAADAILKLIETRSGGPWNVGSGDEITILEIARLIAKLVGYEGKILFDPSKPSGQKKRRLLTTIDFQHTLLEDGLRQTIEYWREQCKSLVP